VTVRLKLLKAEPHSYAFSQQKIQCVVGTEVVVCVQGAIILLAWHGQEESLRG